MEQKQPNHVTSQPQAPHDHHQLRLTNLIHIEEPFDGFHKDGETQGEEEDTVYEGAEDFGTLPAVGVAGGCGGVGRGDDGGGGVQVVRPDIRE